MKFSELYKNNIADVRQALTSMWCGEANNESQRAYVEQLKALIRQVFAPTNAMPVVQCMNSYVPVADKKKDKAMELVFPLWTAPYAPYQHQYESWHALLEETDENGHPLSICVTTGTGSGKTECFMMPLVHDLAKNHEDGKVQALFLYPLNALMEDQKERLEKMLEEVELQNHIKLTFTVFNGDLPEREPKPEDNDENAQKLRHGIELVTGGHYEKVFDPTTGVTTYTLKDVKFPHMLYTRAQVRKTPPNILLTNPTMLEYILLRTSDKPITEGKALSWVAIDETHTYTGAGAAELAMLLRRVLLAFDKKPEEIHFATSSATFGNGDDDKVKLQDFIAGITGTSPKQVKVIDGKRLGEGHAPAGDDGKRWEMLLKAEFLPLDKLFEDKNESIEGKLERLDEMCEREAERCQAANKQVPEWKAKAHYFYRVPNNGLYVRLTERSGGCFNIHTDKVMPKEGDTPLLELSRCRRCGEYVAVGYANVNQGTYEPLESSDADMFDLTDGGNLDNDDKQYAIFGLTRAGVQRGDNNIMIVPEQGNKFRPMMPGTAIKDEWQVVANTRLCCPCCGAKLTRGQDSDDGGDSAQAEDLRLKKFRLSANFISRLIAPSILDQLDKGTSKQGKLVMHDGQQYISFVDSRQGAAIATMQQNLEQERLWFYATIYHELCRLQNSKEELKQEADRLKAERDQYDEDEDEDEYNKLDEQYKKARRLWKKDYLTWENIAQLLLNDKYCSTFCTQFAKRSGDSEELDENGAIRDDVKKQYVQSLMVKYLANKVTADPTQETMGLFNVCYPSLSKIKNLPAEVEAFNALLNEEKNKISTEDWRNFLQIFLDYTVRSNQSYYLKLSDGSKLDIFACVRFATEKPHRRPAKKPKLEKGKPSQARVVRYLCALLKREDATASLNEIQDKHFNAISDVIDALWKALTEETKLIQPGQRWENDKFVDEKNSALRLNLADLAFKLYEETYLCDTNGFVEGIHKVERLRPIENNFKHFSPYLQGTTPVELDDSESRHEVWEAFPYFGNQTDVETVNNWAKTKRRILWENKLWGEDGVFADRLESIHMFPNLFIQAEHTAQVDKGIARKLQEDFKDHAVNILACSTTMEMGVDLGNLEVVMLSSVPPMPSNYKQRAGRSGRNNKVKSACITLCSSDAIGLRTLYSPMERIIDRQVQVPTVDLMSRQVVSRHINAFLVRFFDVFPLGNAESLGQKVADYYTKFEVKKDRGGRVVVEDSAHNKKTPNDKLGDSTDTQYEKFNKKCLLPSTSFPGLDEALTTLLVNTVFESQPHKNILDMARKDNEDRYTELLEKADDLELVYSSATGKYQAKLEMQFIEMLNQKLLTHWATNRFTPNANMPVSVLALDLNGNKKEYAASTSSNPTYALREAIAQYAPGNSIVVDGVVYVARGLDFTNQSRTFQTIYRNSTKTVVGDSSLSSKLMWDVNNKDGVELIRPTAFIPDPNESSSRIIESNPFTRVSAQLIDADDWLEIITEPHLYSVRSNRNTGNAKILYYNQGQGNGYCYCTRCHRTVLETEAADPQLPLKFPREFNNEQKDDKSFYHRVLFGKNMGNSCYGSNHADVVKRNVIIGDFIQTDFCEIRFRHKGHNKWISERNTDEKPLLYTLGIAFSQTLAEILGKDRGAVDFTIMPNGHLCIFDTNPGGAGYANQLADASMMKDVIEASEKLIREAKDSNSAEVLLDKFTIRYLKQLDLDAALQWIADEKEVSDVLPQEVSDLYPNAVPSNVSDLLKDISTAAKHATLFMDFDAKQWDYNGQTGWRDQFFSEVTRNTSVMNFCVTETEEALRGDEPLMAMLRELHSLSNKDVLLMKNPFAQNNLYPLAHVDGMLYFTNNVESSTLNNKWSAYNIYKVRVDSPVKDAKVIDTKPNNTTTKIFFLDSDADRQIHSKDLGKVICNNANDLIKSFAQHCAAHPTERLTVIYQDEHLKSILGMCVTLQTLDYFVGANGLFKNPFYATFMLEQYYDPKGNAGSFTANMPSSSERDQQLNYFVDAWLDDLDDKGRKDADVASVASVPRKDLTHWRELTFECAGKRLAIYPDGGLLNDWSLDRGNPLFDVSQVMYYEDIKLYRKHSIKYDVNLSDI